jgi:23S rRNA-/tRNA-specific pseudouridylate synthase
MIVSRGAATPHRGKWYPADTRLRLLGPVVGGWLWEAVITTGVMHQIRVHAASVGIPLLGDKRYGGGAPPQGSAADFFLHHEGLTGPDLRPPKIPLPDFWPAPR